VTGDIHYGIIPLVGCKSVLTIHDIGLVDNAVNKTIKLKLMEYLYIRIPLMLSVKVVCISNETKRCIQKYTKRKDIVVIHNAIDPIFHREPYVFNEELPNILIIGTNSNKNLERTFKALLEIKCKVTIVGSISESQKIALKENNISYVNKTKLSDEELVLEYNKSDIVSFISLFEGFGMIVVEANKVGRPVITSDIPVLHEVAGDAALYVCPTDIYEMHKAFVRIISDGRLRNFFIEKGYENARRFEPENIRKQWIELYNSII